jgi:hypothetical protein
LCGVLTIITTPSPNPSRRHLRKKQREEAAAAAALLNGEFRQDYSDQDPNLAGSGSPTTRRHDSWAQKSNRRLSRDEVSGDGDSLPGEFDDDCDIKEFVSD